MQTLLQHARRLGCLTVLAVLAAPQVMKAWKFDPAAPENAQYYQATFAQRVEYGFYYLGLTAFLALMTHDVHEMLAPARLAGS